MIPVAHLRVNIFHVVDVSGSAEHVWPVAIAGLKDEMLGRGSGAVRYSGHTDEPVVVRGSMPAPFASGFVNGLRHFSTTFRVSLASAAGSSRASDGLAW